MVTRHQTQPLHVTPGAAALIPSGGYKRPLDLLILLAAHLLLLPLWLGLWTLIPLMILLDSGRPVFYGQRRIGRDGQPFWALKFRTMVRDADRIGPVWTSDGDHRITRVGRLLRATGLDEMPQVINILRGDMSFVGPRPLAEAELHLLSREVPGFEQRLQVPAGLTGMAQVYANRDDAREKLACDITYARSLSLWLDLKLLFLSVWITFRGTWETRGAKL